MKDILEELEQLIRNGQFDEVESRLRKLGKVERKYAVAVANIARRIHRLNLAIKILNPIVRSEDKLQDPPTALEKIEYAEALRRSGAVDEAWNLLSEVDAKLHPQAQVHQIFCLFNQWKYEEALPLLHAYVQLESLAPYARCVGKINLAAAWISVGKLQEAADLLKELREETKKSEFTLLYGNALELSSQVLILQKKYDEAFVFLRESAAAVKGAGHMFNLFAQKWTAIAESLKKGQTLPELREVAAKAQKEKHWETVRDCDLYIAHLDQDRSRFEKLYFGTPYQSFRERIQRFAGEDFKVCESYCWSQSENPKHRLNVATGRVEGMKKAELPIGQALHRFLILLSQDFYRPVSALSAFGKLFPDEYMNATTSANRVHQIVRRCREWFAEINLNLQIEEAEGGYRLALGDDVGLIVPSQPLPLDPRELELTYLKNQISAPVFNIHQASEALAWSNSSTQRLLKWAVDEGRLEKSGKGSRTTYHLKAA